MMTQRPLAIEMADRCTGTKTVSCRALFLPKLTLFQASSTFCTRLRTPLETLRWSRTSRRQRPPRALHTLSGYDRRRVGRGSGRDGSAKRGGRAERKLRVLLIACNMALRYTQSRDARQPDSLSSHIGFRMNCIIKRTQNEQISDIHVAHTITLLSSGRQVCQP